MIKVKKDRKEKLEIRDKRVKSDLLVVVVELVQKEIKDRKDKTGLMLLEQKDRKENHLLLKVRRVRKER